MHKFVRLVVGIALAGFALYASFEQYPIQYIVVALAFAAFFILDLRQLFAKHGESELEARFGDTPDREESDQSDAAAAVRRLSDKRDSRDDDATADTRNEDEKDAPGL